MEVTDLLRRDATALALLGHDVALVPDAALNDPTPCAGWTITDLLRHMNKRHEAVARTVLAPLADPSDDPRDDFARITARFLALLETTETVHHPVRGPLSVAQLLRVHSVDMLVHRWDLARARHTRPVVPPGLAEAAVPLARVDTAAGSPLNAPGGEYRPPTSDDPSGSAMDVLVALLGRDPGWTATADGPERGHLDGGSARSS